MTTQLAGIFYSLFSKKRTDPNGLPFRLKIVWLLIGIDLEGTIF